jgi:hypothetical protein
MVFIQNSLASDIPLPLHGLHYPCSNPRFPTVLDTMVLGCGPDGSVDRMMSLHDQKIVDLPEKNNWSTGEVLFRTGSPGGIWDPTSKRWVSDRILVQNAVGRSQFGLIAVLGETEILLREKDERIQYQRAAKPIGWHPPAITNNVVAWIEGLEQDAKIVIWHWQEGDKITTISSISPLYLYSDESRLVWNEPNRIRIYNTETKQSDEIEVSNIQGLTVDSNLICWSEWVEKDLDIRCDDGFHLRREGNQEWPQLHATGLYFRENGVLMWLPR